MINIKSLDMIPPPLKLCEKPDSEVPDSSQIQELTKSFNTLLSKSPDIFLKDIEMLAKTNNYSFQCRDDNGYTTLAVAVKMGNIPVIKKIIKIGGLHILNIGNYCGQTPLHLAISYIKDPIKRLSTVKILIQSGADVNIIPQAYKLHPNTGSFSLWFTPLASIPLYLLTGLVSIAEKGHYMALAILLLRHGASDDLICEKSLEFIKEAKQLMWREEEKFLFRAKIDTGSILSTLPDDLIQYIVQILLLKDFD